jgi:hypothetical protein
MRENIMAHHRFMTTLWAPVALLVKVGVVAPQIQVGVNVQVSTALAEYAHGEVLLAAGPLSLSNVCDFDPKSPPLELLSLKRRVLAGSVVSKSSEGRGS